MLATILRKIFGSRNDRELKRIVETYLQAVNSLEPSLLLLSDQELRAKTPELKEKLARGATLEQILPEAFAVTREAGRRALNMRHFDVQIIGGAALHEGKISEMRTGEGKTLVATLPLYLNALAGKGAHLVTVNDYLARRDAEWMGKIYNFLGMTVGVIQHGLTDSERQSAYSCDITYATNNELGFDYLRDNMKFSIDQLAQRQLNFAIVDEVDSILIDEARTPLIISGQGEESTDKYYVINRMIPQLLKRDVSYTIDEKARAVMLTEDGIALAEKALNVENLYDPANVEILHHVQQGLRAHTLFRLDVDYVVKDGKVMIVDEFTGRLMPGRRWSDGLHQAIEAKEGVEIENENQTLATITFQNFFRLYNKIGGMTGTADTEAAEFASTYNLEVLIIPTNRDMVRKDFPDLVYKTEKEKFDAIVNEIEAMNSTGQPALVGTISIENSEKLSAALKRKGITHNVLNAKHHEREAEIVAQAGRLNAVTIATNMAGRGTDIILGGNPDMLVRSRGLKPEDDGYADALKEMTEICAREHEKVVSAGGLHIIGTERHESRRIDNQLRGRAGRQGDPGSSRFYLSLEDDLMRIFGGDKLKGLMTRLGMEEGEPIEHRMVTRSIEGAQKKVEAHNFDIRKHLLEYDDVMNKQREVIYDQRRALLSGEGLHETVADMALRVMDDDLEAHTPEAVNPDEWNFTGLRDTLIRQFGLDVKVDEENNFILPGVKLENATITFVALKEALEKAVKEKLEDKRKTYGDAMWGDIIKYVALNIVDGNWRDHLLNMDHLKEGIGLRGYAQKNPLNEYKKEGSQIFMEMIDRVREDIVTYMCHVQAQTQTETQGTEKEEAQLESRMAKRRERMKVVESHGAPPEADSGHHEPVKRAAAKVGRNDPCPCGSGKKYKKCHGAEK
ncbi:MAG: preprotein translocase subunit SecA [Nitrospinae bacterium]|nr:preprotein translocase subunit SecA [Nitrospinota bacterium]MBF0634464.1 preprotein translocase subunit SecA [Nitrospinota bacterium]